MKKVVFLQNEGNVLGGVWFVNKTVGEELLKQGFDVHIISIRNGVNVTNLEYDKNINYEIINEHDKWGIIQGYLIKEDIKKIRIFKAFSKLVIRLFQKIKLRKDYKKCKNRINEINPDYIVASHYEVLDAIPKSRLKRTIFEQHSSFKSAKENPSNYKYFHKYNNKISFLWLSKATMQRAIDSGLKNNYYIYNPSRIESSETADVVSNKKLVTIARLSEQKRIDLMVDIVEKLFSNTRFSDWKFEIYGDGEKKQKVLEKIKNKKQIKIMGLTDTPKEVLLSSSINLNTSYFEGYAMSIVEANECGIPTVSFNFGESVYEQIKNNITGYIIEDDNVEEFVNKLSDLIDNEEQLIKLSYNAKKESENNRINKIIKYWIKLFKDIDRG